jgi:glyoxylate/hydroxypyruvate reductase A
MTLVLIASYLQPSCVERIRAEVPSVEVVYEPRLLPEPRYKADHIGSPPLLSQPDTERWNKLLGAADVMFDFDWAHPSLMSQRCPNLRWVQATSAGIGEYVKEKGLSDAPFVMTTAAGVHAVPLSEFVIGGILYLIKDFPLMERQKSQKHWQRYSGGELSGRRATIVGVGSVGRHVGRTLSHLGVTVTGVSRRSDQATPDGFDVIVPVQELERALRDTDLLIICSPLTSHTRNLIGERELQLLEPGAIVTNIGRGPVIEEKALLRLLDTGHLAGAVLDVFEHEPLPPESPFWELPNVVVSPHSGSTTEGENARITSLFIANLQRFLEQRPLVNLYETDRGY